ncbi:unnamed protein product [Didymodactylos carnosus]|uniref:Saposin B-type domain-containing protein n=1 Tax=Didymodactylos carnosus TaxID=1234261 RepID=A0A8S2I0F0_9BILA|nr:unnamed protein product [Didymodactylos carnosus]CAF3704515.1 unnamed protein product [Didymodactylos carnosus]
MAVNCANARKSRKRLSCILHKMDCATCTIVVGLVEKLSIVHNESIVSSLERICNALPTELKPYCKTAVEFLGPIIIDGFLKKETPDVICHAMKICTTDPDQPECHLFPSKSLTMSLVHSGSRLRRQHPTLEPFFDLKLCTLPGIREICKIFENVFRSHIPLVDVDNDRFGIESAFRGSSWRGRDCNDFVRNIRPGARAVKGDYTVDNNCNGIFGINASTGRPWEEEFCDDTQRLGIAVLGDSISAHFHIPEQWLDASQFSPAAFEHMMLIIENELDWPQVSDITGHVNLTWPNIEGTTRSIYARMFELDHCNHRDYQNIAVNGANSKSMLDIVKTLSRDQENDVPMLVIYSLVGNDVCDGRLSTMLDMTTVEQMRTNVLATLTYLDTVLPKGSHVLATGLANGSTLYELLHDRIHPFGRVGTPFTYKQIYSYLSCLQISPCAGWLTSNDSLCASITQRAFELSDAVKNATLSYTPRNFDVDYLDFLLDDIMAKWMAQGGEPWQLIESVDGFHINQYGHALVSDVPWSWLKKIGHNGCHH